MIEKLRALTPEEMRSIARYERSFTDVVPLPEDGGDIHDFIAVEKPYRYTLEDLEQALSNLMEKDPTVGAFHDGWYEPLSELRAEFGIDALCVPQLDFAHVPGTSDIVRNLPIRDEQVFTAIWEDAFWDLWRQNEDDMHVTGSPLLGELLTAVRLHLKERGKPVTERAFTEQQQLAFIAPFENEDHVKDATETELALCRRFTEALIKKDSVPALRLKGYACYGGNALYACDWPTSRDCMLRLYELTEDHTYANTLGYIYYYGRCTGGKPEYEKAFSMFSIAAANGMHEGIYKLADMFRHGYACKKSPATAKALYGIVYEDCRKKFLDGSNGSFADAAIRIGSVYLRGIDEEPDAEAAYAYFLQADYAHRLRSEGSDFFGDATIAINIRKSLDEARALLPGHYFKEYLESETPWPLRDMLKENGRCALRVTREENGDATLCMTRVPVHKGLSVQPLLLTLPELDYCALTTEVVMKVRSAKVAPAFEDGAPHLVDYAEWNIAEQRLDCYFADELCGWLFAKAYRLYAPEKPAPTGKELRFVSVRFTENGRTYDYLCEDETVRPGDTVTVHGYNGDTAVTVERVFTARESELAIPVERYKKAVKA